MPAAAHIIRAQAGLEKFRVLSAVPPTKSDASTRAIPHSRGSRTTSCSSAPVASQAASSSSWRFRQDRHRLERRSPTRPDQPGPAPSPGRFDSAHPTSIASGRAGLASGPAMLNTVGTPSSRRVGPANLKAG